MMGGNRVGRKIGRRGTNRSTACNRATITGSDLKAFNTFESPKHVAPQAFEKPVTTGGRTKFEVPARSYTVIQWGA